MSVDYRRFLGRTEERVLAYLGGDVVTAADRGLRVDSTVPPGWWRFSIRGRKATPVRLVDPPEELLARLAAAVGHWTGTRLAYDAGPAEPLHLLPEDELVRFTPCRARRWHSGDLVFERTELEGEAEDTARRAFEDRAPLGGAKGISGTLRAAFALAVVADVSSRTGVPAAPMETGRELLDIAEHGWPAAESVVDRLRRQREAEAARTRNRAVRRPSPPARALREDDSAARATDALAASGASLLASHRLADGLLAVTYRFLGERLRAIVVADSLQVVDAGVCLAGHDRDLTLASLPGAIREGMESGQLVITDHA